MKKINAIVCFSVLAYGSIAAHNLPDSGFTNKKEAKNLMVNGLKEGRWVEYPYSIIFGIQPHEHYRRKYPVQQVHRSADSSYRLIFYHDGLANGTVRDYFTNGILRGEQYYIEGKQNGVGRYYYASGKLSSIFPYKNGMLEGERKDYYESGKLKGYMNFIHDRPVGVSRYYYESGNIQYENTYVNGTVTTSKNYQEIGNENK
jgi:antitoxin component YwqK of YwqJK toxin-antitoxin module